MEGGGPFGGALPGTAVADPKAALFWSRGMGALLCEVGCSAEVATAFGELLGVGSCLSDWVGRSPVEFASIPEDAVAEELKVWQIGGRRATLFERGQAARVMTYASDALELVNNTESETLTCECHYTVEPRHRVSTGH